MVTLRFPLTISRSAKYFPPTELSLTANKKNVLTETCAFQSEESSRILHAKVQRQQNLLIVMSVAQFPQRSLFGEAISNRGL